MTTIPRRSLLAALMTALASPALALPIFRPRVRVGRTLLNVERRQGTFYSTSVDLDGQPFSVSVRGIGRSHFLLAAQRFDADNARWVQIAPPEDGGEMTLTGITGRVNFELDVQDQSILGIVEVIRG